MSPFRTSPAARRSPRCHRTANDLGTLADGDIVELAARLHRVSAGRARAPRAAPLRRRCRARRLSTARCAFSRAQAVAPHSSSSPRPSSISSGRERRRRRSRSSAPRSSGRARRSRPLSARSAYRCRVEARTRLGATAFGQALLSLLRFSWSNGTRRDLYAFLRTPYAGLLRPDVDFLEGRLRGRAVLRGDRTVEETTKLRNGRPLPIARPGRARRRAARGGACRRAGDGPQRSRPRRTARDRAGEARPSRCGGRERGRRRAGTAARSRCRDPRRRRPRGARPGNGAGRRRPRTGPRRRPRPDAGPHAQLRGGLHRRARAGVAAAKNSDLAVSRRRDSTGPRRCARCAATASRYRQPRPLSVLHRLHPAADACSPSSGRRRPTTDRRVSRARSGRRCASSSTGMTCGGTPRRRPLSRLTWPIESAPTERERLRALARLAADDPREADALAYANGWQRKLGRARSAFARGDRDPSPARPGAPRRAARRSGSRISSGWPAARRPGSSSATSVPARSTRPSTRGCEARSLTSPCSASTASFRPPSPGRSA